MGSLTAASSQWLLLWLNRPRWSVSYDCVYECRVQSGCTESVAQQQCVEHQWDRATLCEPSDSTNRGPERFNGEGRRGGRMDVEEYSDYMRRHFEDTYVSEWVMWWMAEESFVSRNSPSPCWYMTEFSFSPSSCCIESFLNSVVAGNLDYASNINPQYNTLAIYNSIQTSIQAFIDKFISVSLLSVSYTSYPPPPRFLRSDHSSLTQRAFHSPLHHPLHGLRVNRMC